MKWWVLSIIFSFLLSCNTTDDRHIDPYSPNFNTTEAAELYFKNVRQFYYDLDEQDGENRYRLSKSNQEARYPNLILIINMDWRNDQAYLSFENNAYFSKDSPIEVQVLTPEGVVHYKLQNRDRIETFAFVSKLYQCILKDQELFVLVDGKRHRLLNDQVDREAFRITAFDFYRLVGLQ